MKRTILALICLAALGTQAPVMAQSYSIFETAQSNLTESVPMVAERIATNARAAGFSVLSRHDSGAPGTCAYRAHVISLAQPEFIGELFSLRADTAPFAAVDRIVVFSDENGTHVAYVNPAAVVRTVLLDNAPGTASALEHRAVLASVTAATASFGYGPERERGLIGKTMGVMAGGPFDEKIQTHGSVPNTNWMDVTNALEASFQTAGKDWGLKALYRLDLEPQGVAILGVSGAEMEAKSFDIVGAGSNDARDGLSCPGLAHAAAYPLEIVVRQVGSDVEIQFVDAMYRMKLYFEDAGKWAFMKNMTMPGSIADELKTFIQAALMSM